MHLLLRVRTVQNRPSTQILVEVEVVAARGQGGGRFGQNQGQNQSYDSHSRHTQVVEASLEAGGAKEDVAKVPDRILVIAAVTLNVITVVKGDISPENVQRRRLIITGIGKGKQNNYALSSRQADDRSENLFVMQHMMNAVTADVSTKDDVWYVDLGASNHMTSQGEWFRELKDPKTPGYVETGDDTAHPIAHTRNVPLSMQDGKMKYLQNVLHVPTITKNLVSCWADD